MIPTTIAPISGHHHRSGSYSQPQEHQGAAQNDHHHPNHQQPLDGPYPHFDTRGRPVPGVCFFLLLSFLIDRALILLLLKKKVIQPARNKPTDDEFFTYDDIEGSRGEKKPDHEFLKSHFYREGRLTEDQALYILEHATKIFSTEPNMVPVKSPVTSAYCVLFFFLVLSDFLNKR